MATSASKYTKQIHIIGDFLLINFAFFDGYFLKFGNLNIFEDGRYFLFIVYYNIAWLTLANTLKSYDFVPNAGIENLLRKIFRLFGFHLLAISVFWVFIKGYFFSREHLLTVYTILFVTILSWRMTLYYFLKLYRKQWFKLKNALIIGYGETSVELSKLFYEHPEYGYNFLGFLHDKSYQSKDIIGRISDLPSIGENIVIDEIFCSLPDVPNLNIDELADYADNNVIRFRILPDFRSFTSRNILIDLFEHIPLISFRNLPQDDAMNRAIKRAFDVFFSALVILLLLSWLVPLIALLIRLQSRGPIFFRQKRTGKSNVDFWCYKFRSMYVNKESDKVQARKGDDRITPIGAFIRKTSIDELPQFFNVFLGHMSVVGPRPHMLRHTEEYSQIIKKYMVRHFVKPGITGLAQIRGYRGETRDTSMMQGRIKFDIFYIENWSFFLDLKIIFYTVRNVVFGEENAR
ncbi:MAG: undecaprenyl-phosphate glucose phosphotransferase [Cytophagales bacterium]